MSDLPVINAAAHAADAGLHGIQRQLEAPAPHRPRWQRWLLPVIGTVLTLGGVVLFFLPFTNLLLIIGLPLMFCFSRRWENAARARMRRLILGMRRWLPIRRWR